jgi:phosphate starvation-inducible protein PhoH
VLFGEKNAHLQKIEDMLDIEISSRGNEVLSAAIPSASSARGRFSRPYGLKFSRGTPSTSTQ